MRRILLSTFLLAAAGSAAGAQPGRTPSARGYAFSTDDRDRAILGVTTQATGRRDTLGVLVAAVTPGSPAEKAGIEEGNRIASINGVNLKLSRDDADDSDMSGAMTNRLQRELRKLKAGDEATLEVWASGRSRSVKVKTVAADELEGRRYTRIDAGDRPVLGLSISSTGSKRDTLGVFVAAVAEDGPAEKAGIVEGDRIASINGVDLRTAREDAGDGWTSSNRTQRMERELQKAKVGSAVELVVSSGGRSRTVKVTAARAGDLRNWGGGAFMTGPGMLAMPPGFMAPRVRVFRGDDGSSFDMGELRNRVRDALRDARPMIRGQLDEFGPELRMHLEEIGPQIRRQMEDLGPQIRRQMEDVGPEVRRKLEDIGPQMRRQMDELKSELRRHPVVI
jgi:predicted metalloprotease with PDZ domain